MAALDLEAEYNNRQRVPEHAEINARWQAASAAYRQAANGRSRPALRAAASASATISSAPATPRRRSSVYIHGGYWQRGDRKDYSFLARSSTPPASTSPSPPIRCARPSR